mmetsp:Transcript_29127/g.83620  ORF Transcript_29127/g.83620 Transcript_29127/m.83620 type:complete len:88 (-) Transcript_29127:1337-1600(-)
MWKRVNQILRRRNKILFRLAKCIDNAASVFVLTTVRELTMEVRQLLWPTKLPGKLVLGNKETCYGWLALALPMLTCIRESIVMVSPS